MVRRRELFEAWCEDPKNGVIIADFAVAGTLAREVLDEPKEVMSHSGHKVIALSFCCSVHHCVLHQHNTLVMSVCKEPFWQFLRLARCSSCSMHDRG